MIRNSFYGGKIVIQVESILSLIKKSDPILSRRLLQWSREFPLDPIPGPPREIPPVEVLNVLRNFRSKWACG